MPCIHYVPSKGVTPVNANAYLTRSQVELCFKIVDVDFKPLFNKTEEESESGRPCVTGTSELLEVTFTTAQMSRKLEPQWIEFMRSTGCGQQITISAADFPQLGAWGVSSNAIVTGQFNFRKESRSRFSVTFTVRFWEFVR